MARTHVVVFSFNRALQADATLRSIQSHLAGGDFQISVVWRCEVDHKDSYALLRERHEPLGVRFYEEQLGLRPWLPVLPTLAYPRNLRKWQQLHYLRKLTGFKPLVDRILSSSECSVMSFQTDDCVYCRDEDLPASALKLIRNSPAEWSYRCYAGGNQSDCPGTMRNEGELLAWDYYDPEMHRHWAYPFSVDCTFYDTRFLRRFLSRLLYTNPIGLEHFGVKKARRSCLFRYGLSPKIATAVSLPLNKVDFTYSGNRHADVSLEMLRNAFVDGFELDYDLSRAETESVVVPDRIWLRRGSEVREILVTEQRSGA